MYLNDPTLYGATLPQKELPIPTPFVHPFFAAMQPMQGMPWQGMPWQGFQGQTLPWQWQNLQPWQGIQSWQNMQPWQNVQRYVPPFFAQGVLPQYGQSYGYTPYMSAPYGPMGFNPYVQPGFHNMPLTAWQRYCY